MHLEATNELADLLETIKSHTGYSLKKIAESIGYEYGYLRSAKSGPNPSPTIIKRIHATFADVLRKHSNGDNDLASSKNNEVKEDSESYKYYKALLAEKEARRKETEERALRAEAENNRLLNIIENNMAIIQTSLAGIQKSQETTLSYQEALLKHITKDPS
jgi:hypothetical protein